MHNLTCGLGDDYIRLFGWHVAVNALVHDFLPQRFRKAAALPLMARQALLRIEFSRLSA
jgi:hypothetical protein